MPDELFMRAKKNDPNLPRHCLEQSVISDVGSDDGFLCDRVVCGQGTGQTTHGGYGLELGMYDLSGL